ncbi:MAG: thioredoxin family protein [Muribaculaceae bacterium]
MDYNQLINSNPVVLVEFYATWCPHCRRMMPVVDDVRQLVEGQAKIYQLDIDQNNDVADDAGVKSVPTFIVYRDGKEKWRSSGEIDGNVLYEKITQTAQ